MRAAFLGWLCCVCLVSPLVADEATEPTTYDTLREEMLEAVRYARKPGSDLAVASRRLLVLHDEVATHEDFRDRQKKELLGMCRARLVRVGDTLAARILIARREDREEQFNTAPYRKAVEALREFSLVQETRERESTAEETSDESASEESSAENGAAGGAAQPDEDYGPQLVEIIQQVVMPDAWQENGGASVVVYFRPKMVLVITAPSEVHGNVGKLLGQFRR